MPKPKNKNLSLDKRIGLYVKLESSLREFFDSTDYCQENCFSQKEAIIGWTGALGMIKGPGNEGCCHKEGREFNKFSFGTDKFFDKENGYEEEFQETQKKNILEEYVQTGTCEYHTDKGCAITKLRSPICNYWICFRYSSYLSREFNINYRAEYYSDNPVKSLLGVVFDKEVDTKQIEKTLENLKMATQRIREKKSVNQHLDEIDKKNLPEIKI